MHCYQGFYSKHNYLIKMILLLRCMHQFKLDLINSVLINHGETGYASKDNYYVREILLQFER